MIAVDLQSRHPAGAKPPRHVYLSEIRGEDELADNMAVDLIDRLLLDLPDAAVRPGEARRLTLSEQDRLLASIYRQLYGDIVESHLACEQCGGAFALRFSLEALAQSVESVTAEDHDLLQTLRGPDHDGVYQLDEQLRFRLPTGEDLAATGRSDPAAQDHLLRERCVVSPGSNIDERALNRAMALVGPLLDTDVEAACALCGHQQSVRFNIADYLTASLRRERSILIREVHEIARAYRWSRAEILAMSRGTRREHVTLILADAEARGALS